MCVYQDLILYSVSRGKYLFYSFYPLHSCRLLKNRPIPLSLFVKCIEIEKSSAAGDGGVIVRLREMYESALREYGSSQPGEGEKGEEGGREMDKERG